MSQELTREQAESMFAYARKFGGEGLDAPFARLLDHDQAQRDIIVALLLAAKSSLNYLINTQRSFGIEDGSDDELKSTKLCRIAIAKAESVPESLTIPRAESGPIGAK